MNFKKKLFLKKLGSTEDKGLAKRRSLNRSPTASRLRDLALP